MKRILYLLFAASLVLSCSKENSGSDPTPTPVKPQTYETNVMTAYDSTAIGKTKLDVSKFNTFGLVKDKVSGKGIPGVAVSDGFSVVRTDANGVYQLARVLRTRRIFISVPSEYEIPLDSKNGLPFFFSSTGPKSASTKYRCDFHLTPLSQSEDEVNLVMIGDPQCKNQELATRYKTETIADIQKTMASYKNVYCMTLGDITSDSNSSWSHMQASMSNVKCGGRNLPFFQTIGNHDHNGIVADGSKTPEENSFLTTESFNELFGPVYYSFNRGNLHVVSIDDVWVTGQKTSSAPNKYTCSYTTGIQAYQAEWLRQDIAAVDDKDKKTIIICYHIPITSSYFGKNNVDVVFDVMKEFNQGLLFSAHSHHPYINIEKTKQAPKSGIPIYQHTCGTACGAWWSCNSQTDGTPNCYYIFTFNRDGVRNWVSKPTSHGDFQYDESFQIRVFDGNQKYNWGAYPIDWTTKLVFDSFSSSPFTAKECQDAFIAQVAYDDIENWKVELYIDGKKAGDFTKINSGRSQMAATSFFVNIKVKANSSSNFSPSGQTHLWYIKCPTGAPADAKNWEVRATQTIPHSGQVNTYTCNTLTTGYESF